MPQVIKVKMIKEEAVVIHGSKDIEDLVINTLGEHVWMVIQDFALDETSELKDKLDCLNDDIKSYDVSLTALRGDVRDVIEEIDELIDKINNAQRLNKDSIVKKLESIIKTLHESEGYI